MKKILENFKGGIVFGVGLLLTLLVGGSIYAIVNNVWTEPNSLQATAGEPLTADNWNKVLSDLEHLKTETISSINYSTEEQDTGTLWVNGKKIYQRTIGPYNVLIASKNTFVELYNFTENIDKIIKMNGTARSGSNGYQIPIPYGTNASGGSPVNAIDYYEAAKAIRYQLEENSDHTDIYVTIQYTKK